MVKRAGFQKAFIFNIFILAISFIVLEFLLRLFTIYPKVDNPPRVYHPQLSYVMNSAYPGIDRFGFRNTENLPRPRIAAIGDSHTYGFNVSSSNSWPTLLSNILDRPIYNYGIGGYGIAQYWHLYNDAVKNGYREIIIGLYLGNDFVNNVNLDQTYLQSFSHKNDIEYFDIERENVHSYNDRKIKSKSKVAVISAISDMYNAYLSKSKNESSAVTLQAYNTKTYMKKESIKGFIEYLTPGVKKGHHEFSIAILREIFHDANSNNIDLRVLLLPTKPTVMFNANPTVVKIAENLEELVRSEEKLLNQVKEILSESDIPFIDVKAYLQESISSGKIVYPESSDGHPLESGYQAYALAARDLIIREIN